MALPCVPSPRRTHQCSYSVHTSNRTWFYNEIRTRNSLLKIPTKISNNPLSLLWSWQPIGWVGKMGGLSVFWWPFYLVGSCGTQPLLIRDSLGTTPLAVWGNAVWHLYTLHSPMGHTYPWHQLDCEFHSSKLEQLTAITLSACHMNWKCKIANSLPKTWLQTTDTAIVSYLKKDKVSNCVPWGGGRE